MLLNLWCDAAAFLPHIYYSEFLTHLLEEELQWRRWSVVHEEVVQVGSCFWYFLPWKNAEAENTKVFLVFLTSQFNSSVMVKKKCPWQTVKWTHMYSSAFLTPQIRSVFWSALKISYLSGLSEIQTCLQDRFCFYVIRLYENFKSIVTRHWACVKWCLSKLEMWSSLLLLKLLVKTYRKS